MSDCFQFMKYTSQKDTLEEEIEANISTEYSRNNSPVSTLDQKGFRNSDFELKMLNSESPSLNYIDENISYNELKHEEDEDTEDKSNSSVIYIDHLSKKTKNIIKEKKKGKACKIKI